MFKYACTSVKVYLGITRFREYTYLIERQLKPEARKDIIKSLNMMGNGPPEGWIFGK